MVRESLFVSDLHLTAARPETARRFLRFLATGLTQAERLYILGDLFDAYVGDDNNAWPFGAVKATLRDAAESGVAIHFQHGNRDFLVGDRFAAETGATLLGDFALIDLYGTPTLLTHGDLLCTDDVQYQAARVKVRMEEWKQNALGKPLWMRRLYARWYRYKSGRDKSGKSYDIMDVNPDAVLAALREHGALRLIHGHTHRPAVHDFTLDGRPAQRVVLPEWNGGESVLAWTEEGFERRAIE